MSETSAGFNGAADGILHFDFAPDANWISTDIPNSSTNESARKLRVSAVSS